MNQRLKPALWILLFVLLALNPSAAGQRKGDIASLPFSPAPYRVGERLTYDISFSNFISAAHVEIRVVALGTFFGHEAIQLRGHVETTGVVNVALFAINDDYVSYVDPQTGLPFRSELTTHEGPRATASNQQLSAGLFDFLSAIYRVRATALTEGSTQRLSIRNGADDYQVELKVSGRQSVKTKAGSFNAIAAQVRITNNSTVRNIRVFFSEDERHLPVLATARLSGGEVRAELAASDLIKPLEAQPSPAPPVITSGPATSPTPQPETAVRDHSLDNLPFKVGEQLNYQVFLGSMTQPAGTATFHVRARSNNFSRDGLQYTVQAQTTPAVQRMFVANDLITSYVDVKTLLPFRTELKLVEGRSRTNQILSINQDYGVATTDQNQKIEIPVGTHDYLSFFYLARTFNLTPPRRNAVSILVKNKPTTLFITSLKRETIQLGSQTIPAIQVSLTTDDAQPDKFQLRGWLSDDRRRLPLRLTAVTELGPVRADLAIIPLTSQ
ncbi:MAG TPA: DUF3108 domain-containing protein [Pyrinomonadaceae bacterium]|nr:DUF3108 domain-containing protein [Pyrinomonadaceae bacterium]